MDSTPRRDLLRRWGVPLVVVLLFAAGMLQFGAIGWRQLPADQRINNGKQPTFFAMHLVPAFNFSEDFYLYYVRASRIAKRGWSDSLLYDRENEGTNITAPIQVALSSIAIKTDGRPVPYSIYMFTVTALAWMALYSAARSWFPASVRTASILLAVLITVLFESTPYLFQSPEWPTFGQWPVFRGLRMSTMCWTSPMLVATMLCLSSLAVDRSRWWPRALLLTGMLLLLGGTDNWAFALAWVSTGLTLLLLTGDLLWQRFRTAVWSTSSLKTILGIGVVAAIAYGFHRFFSSAMTGDMLVRAGIGEAWAEAEFSTKNVVPFYKWFYKWGLLPVAAVLLGSWLTLRPGASRIVPAKLAAREQTAFTRQSRLLVLLPLIGGIAVFAILHRGGMEPYLRNQLFWRMNYCWLFALVVATLEWWRSVLTALFAKRSAASAAESSQPKKIGRLGRYWNALDVVRPKTWTAAMAIVLVGFFVYHQYRIYRFVGNVAAKHFFLSAEIEELRPWLEEFERKHGRFELATASYELNYLAAFWTNADLLLPSGFPYHNAASNDEIHERSMQLLRLYRATPRTWMKFTARGKGRFVESWMKSRAEFAGRSCLYHLYHRMWTLDSPIYPKWRDNHRELVSRSLKVDSTTHGATMVGFQPPATDVVQPEVILIDDSSRALGQPDLSNYALEFSSGTLEAWVRKDVAGKDNAKPRGDIHASRVGPLSRQSLALKGDN